MSEQQLLTDLAIAERNTKGRLRFYDIDYAEEIRDAFSKYHVHSYYDLVRTDIKRALELRALAVKEHLI